MFHLSFVVGCFFGFFLDWLTSHCLFLCLVCIFLCHIAHWLHLCPVFTWFKSAQNLAQISDLQAQLEEALKEKQEVQEKVGLGFLPFAPVSSFSPISYCELNPAL